MSLFFPPFFSTNEYFIDEKVQFLKFHNEYKVYDENGFPIGTVRQHVPGFHKFLRLILNKKMMPFQLAITDTNDQVVASIHRGWTFWLSKIAIRDGNGSDIGFIKQKFSILKPRFHIFDTSGQMISEISGDWKAWNFRITDTSGAAIGTISKKWAGLAKEFFTSADKYNVSIAPEYAEDRNKMNIVATAITIDMVLKESK
ncbi:LURP-one-related/scramblase family protein [Flaviaesturariibacter aridisoli]|uniref:Scramblase n=1 Tax=Flaviaesturariibacter aridisoli TaxID=2545761 RepID=A0A4R4DX57_9BACT|nr:phospholipid scramblase-related protein [Flaviaesturariibacter aridisoli]TCZ69065.1 scramblase [Flaviaesturariibacter aridisoli]